MPGEVREPPSAGQWWETRWGYRFFMQWFGPEYEYFDEFQLQFQIEQIERHQPKLG